MFDKTTEEMSPEDWRALRRAAFALSEKVLEALEDDSDREGEFSPQVAGYALVIAMGRLGGRHGYRGISLEEMWKLWTDEGAEHEFRAAFELERQAEN